MPATSNSALRSSMFFTGLPPAFFDRLAVLTSQRSAENLLPKPPPMFCCNTLMLPAGTLKRLGHLRGNARDVLRGDVNHHLLFGRPLAGGAVRLQAGVHDARRAIYAFRYGCGRSESLVGLSVRLQRGLLVRRLRLARRLCTNFAFCRAAMMLWIHTHALVGRDSPCRWA